MQLLQMKSSPIAQEGCPDSFNLCSSLADGRRRPIHVPLQLPGALGFGYPAIAKSEENSRWAALRNKSPEPKCKQSSSSGRASSSLSEPARAATISTGQALRELGRVGLLNLGLGDSGICGLRKSEF